jgi:putative ABC transport system permease protein
VRERDALEATCLACLARERARLGRLGVPYAWTRLIADTVIAAIVLRLDERGRRRLAWRHAQPSAANEFLITRIWQDVKYAARLLQRDPLFSLVVIATLAVTIGATTAVFTVVNAVLLRALPYRDPTRLVLVQQAIGTASAGFSAPDYLAFEGRAGFFESLAAFRNREYELSGVEPPERIIVTRASATLFETLGVRPALGHPFTRKDDESARPVAVLSDALWTRKFGRDPAAVGRAILLDRRPFTIIGVMPKGFTFPQRGPLINNVPGDVYVPIGFTPSQRRGFGSMYAHGVVARLKPGMTVARADLDTRALVQSNAREIYPASLSGLAAMIGGSVTALNEEVIGRSRTHLWVVFAAVGCVLLIACADIASLMLARATGREREIAVRSALGAGRDRLIRQLLAESALLALVGSVLGLLLAVWLSRALVTLAPSTLPRLDEIGVDTRSFLFTAALSVATALLCGTLPALELTRPRAAALKEGSRTSTGRRERRVFGTLVAAQLAIAVVLLVGGGLLVRSFSKLMAVDPGFRVERVLTLATSLPAAGYRDAASVRGFYTRLLDDLSHVPGVSAAGVSTDLPLDVRDRRVFTIEQESPATRELSHSVAPEYVAGRYFEALGVPLKRGRYLGADDAVASEPVAVINETMARRFWGTSDPIGQRIAWGMEAAHGPWMRIVGVVGDVKQGPLNTEIVPQTYTPWMQLSDGMIADNVVGIMRSLRVVLRVEVEPTAVTDTVRAHIRAIDPALPVTSVQTMSEIVKRTAAVPRFNALLVSLFAVLALLLAAIGIVGMLGTSVSRRLPELGIRMALGAPQQTLLVMVIRQGMIPVAAGFAIGLLSAWLVSRVLSSLLFGITPRDPMTFAAVAGLLGVVALVACALPAWRVTRVDPLKVLRVE